MELTVLNDNLREFTRALTALTKIGDDIDLSFVKEGFKLSTVNSSRTAFGIFIFEPAFFAKFVTPEKGVKVCVVGKALLAPLKTSKTSSATIESCSFSLKEDDADAGDAGGECRLVIRLFCQHGVIKTHRLNYSAPTLLYANAVRDDCSSFWAVSSRILKDWTDHFHQKTGHSGGTSEISFIHSPGTCRIKSFSTEAGASAEETISPRPVATELILAIEDFDNYDITSEPTITFSLREFKGIVSFADSVSVPLSVAFAVGGAPLMIDLDGDLFDAHFVVATTDFEGGEDGQGPKIEEREIPGKGKSEKRKSASSSGGGSGETRNGSATAARSNSNLNANAQAGTSNVNRQNAPLFNPPSPSQEPQDQNQDPSWGEGYQPMDVDPGPSGGRHNAPPSAARGKQKQEEEEEEDEFDLAVVEFGEEDYNVMDSYSQVPQPKSTAMAAAAAAGVSGGEKGKEKEREVKRERDATEVLVPDSGEEDEGQEEQEVERMQEEQSVEEEDVTVSRVGPTQKKMRKKSKWNLLDD